MIILRWLARGILIGEIDLVFEADNGLHCFIGEFGLGVYAEGWEIYKPAKPVGV